MNAISRPWPLVVAAGIAIAFGGCGGAPPAPAPITQPSPSAATVHYGSSTVYGHLVSGSGGSWVFATITDVQIEPDNGFLVRLNDLTPVFDTRLASCEPQPYPDNHKCNPVHPFRDKNLGVMGKIISGSIAAGTAGKVTDITRSYETTFDEARFNKAVDEALINTGLDKERAEFLRLLDRYAETLGDGRALLDELQGEARSEYERTAAIPLKIDASIRGLTEYYVGNVDFKRLVKLVPRSEDSRPVAIELEGARLLPCPARQCMVEARAELQKLKADIERSRATLTALLRDETSGYDIRCDETQDSGYHFKLDCPAEMSRRDVASAPIPVTITILSRDFDGLFPVYRIGDDQLEILIDGSGIDFVNRTGRYITLDKQTLYYNSQVNTTSRIIDLAPGTTVRLAIGEFSSPAVEIESRYREMTPDKAARASFNFGFAVNYTLAGDAEPKTLFERRTFNVGCVIRNSISPGSCLEVSDALQSSDVTDDAAADSRAIVEVEPVPDTAPRPDSTQRY